MKHQSDLYNAPMSETPSRGHTTERFHVDGQGQVQIGDRNYYGHSSSPPCRFHNKHFEVPRNPSSAFTGRKDIGERLRSHCLPSTTLNSKYRQKRFVIYGLGGSGKTQVCLKFAEDHREEFWGIFWIDASSTESLERGYLQVAKVCSLELQVDGVKRWLSNISEPWALIFDNADDPRLDLSPYFPVGNRGIVLITTRNPECQIHATVGSYELGAMELDEAITLILTTSGVRDRLDESIRENAKPVVTTLGYLALAIVQAGAAIRQGLCKMDEYCTLYCQRRRELLSQKAIQDGEDYRYTVYTTWEVSLRILEEMPSEAGRDAMDLLQTFSFLHYDGIPEEIFYRAWKNLRSEPPSKPPSEWILSHQLDIIRRQSNQEWDVYPLRAALSILRSFSLINRNKDGLISIHPLVHAWTRDRLSPSDAEMIWTRTTLTVAFSTPWTIETRDYRFRRSLVPHIDACIGSRNDGIFYLRDLGDDCQRMATNFAGVYSEVGRWQEALRLTKQVVEARKRTLGEEHPDTLNSMHNLAIDYSVAGRQEEALQLIERVVEAKKRTLGEEHSNTLDSMHSLAVQYSQAGRRKEALQLTERVVEARKRTLGDEHSDTLDSIDNLAIRYSETGRRQEALQLTEQVVKARKRTLGEEHPNTLGSMHNLAIDYNEADRRQEALQLMERVVEERKKALGEEHHDTLSSMENLAINYSKAGRQQEAVQLTERVLEARKRTLGREHPDTLRSMHNLAISHIETDRQQKALQLTERVVEARKRTLGEEHCDTLSSMDNLAINYSKAGRHQEAVQLTERVVEARKKTLGKEHPDTLRSMHNLAIDYNDSDRWQEALQLTERVVEARKRTLGKEHPDTLDSIDSLAIRYSETGRHQEALQLTERVVETRKRILGEEHPDTLRSMHNLAVDYNETDRQQEAVQLMEKVVEAKKRTLGEDNPETLESIDNLALRYSEAGRRKEALQLAERVVKARKSALSEEHHDTLSSMDNLAIRYSKAGRRREAVQLTEQTVEARKRILGKEHPDTLHSIHTLVLLNGTPPNITETHQPLSIPAIKSQARDSNNSKRKPHFFSSILEKAHMVSKAHAREGY